MLLKSLYIQALIVTFVHIVTLHYIADIIDHTSLVFIVLVFRLMVLGEYCPKENSYKFILQDQLLFKGNWLCVPKGSVRENIVKEKHCGSLAGHFGIDKTLEQVKIFFLLAKDAGRY